MKRLIFCILWLVYNNICVKCVEESDNNKPAAVASDTTTKAKRYLHHGLSHDFSTPCPPFYPHVHTPVHPIHPEYPMKSPVLPLYGLQKPIYSLPKPAYSLPISSHHHHKVQFIHQPPTSYVAKQPLHHPYHDLKPHISMPLYHYLPPPPAVAKPVINHEVQPIQHLVKQQAQWQYPQPHALNYDKPHFAYASTYHKPMIQQVSYANKGWEYPINYQAAKTNNFIAKPGIVYKSESSHHCEPCHQVPAKLPLIQHKSLPQIIHVTPSYVKPVIHSAPIKPAPYYLPSQSHVQLPIIKHASHDYPCNK